MGFGKTFGLHIVAVHLVIIVKGASRTRSKVFWIESH